MSGSSPVIPAKEHRVEYVPHTRIVRGTIRPNADPAFLMPGGWVYMMTNRYRGTISTGVTADIVARVWQHRAGSGSKFTTEYGLTRLVYAEPHDTIVDAITREKRIKKWNRDWKIRLIEESNPDWRDHGRRSTVEKAGSPPSQG